MIESLVEQIETRFAEVGRLMTDPEVIGDRNRYAEVGREYRRLGARAQLAGGGGPRVPGAGACRQAGGGVAARLRRRGRRARAAGRGRGSRVPRAAEDLR